MVAPTGSASGVSIAAKKGLLEPDLPLSPVQWGALLGSLVVVLWSIPGLIINPDFTIGDGATSKLVLGVDMNGWHAVSGLLVGIPGLAAALQVRLSALFTPVAAGGLLGTAFWALFTDMPVGGLFFFPNPTGDVILHVITSGFFVAGAVHYYLVQSKD